MKALKIKTSLKALKVLLVSFLLFPFSSCNEMSSTNEKLDLKAMEDPVASDSRTTSARIFQKGSLGKRLDEYLESNDPDEKVKKLNGALTILEELTPRKHVHLIQGIKDLIEHLKMGSNYIEHSRIIAEIENIDNLLQQIKKQPEKFLNKIENMDEFLKQISNNVNAFLINYFMSKHADPTIESLENYKIEAEKISPLPEDLKEHLESIKESLSELQTDFNIDGITRGTLETIKIINKEDLEKRDLIKQMRDHFDEGDGDNTAVYNLHIIKALGVAVLTIVTNLSIES